MVMSLVLVHLTVAAAQAGLREDVERMVRSAQLKGATVAVSIRDTGSGTALVSINDAVPMAPASNMKLFTSGAALHALGADFRFATKLVKDGDKLIVVGDGDPAFADPDLLAEMTVGDRRGLDVESFLELWVKPVVDSGVKHISEVVVDDRIFDREFVHPTWPVDQLNNSYCAQTSGFMFHGNVLHFYPKPRKGQAPIVTDCRPEAPWLKITNSASSREGSDDKGDIWVARKPNTNELTFHGNVRYTYKSPVAVTVNDMPSFFAELLADRLRRAGITVDGHRVSKSDDRKNPGQIIGPIITTPLSTVITRCNRDSENMFAESLLKRVGFAMTGEPGSWLNGSTIIRHIIHERLDDPSLASGIVIVDGSGLSQDNRITATAMTAWLNSFSNDPKLGQVLIDSLAVAGQSGTLQKRYKQADLHGALVQAKTGYIKQVSCLSGFVTMPDGRRRVFSVLVNGLKDVSCVPLAKKLQDQIVCAIAEDMAESGMRLGGN
jgi:serine-type D-Ala-D-Ala carboxypeptidase/endopeptidase (penicillin-binding protein 4)